MDCRRSALAFLPETDASEKTASRTSLTNAHAKRKVKMTSQKEKLRTVKLLCPKCDKMTDAVIVESHKDGDLIICETCTVCSTKVWWHRKIVYAETNAIKKT